MAPEAVPLIVIQRQLGHSNLGTASVYLQGIDSGKIIVTMHGRSAPMISASGVPSTARPTTICWRLTFVRRSDLKRVPIAVERSLSSRGSKRLAAGAGPASPSATSAST